MAATFNVPQRQTGVLLTSMGMNQPAFTSLWSSKSLRSTQFPEADWATAWPGNAGTGPRDNRAPLGSRGIGTYTVVGSGAWSHQQLLLGMDDEVGLLTVVPQRSAMTTHAANGSALIPVMSSRLLCFDKDGCRCPDGTTVGTRLSGQEMIFSMGADAERPHVQAAGERWDDAAKKKYCNKEKEKKRSTHNGDPHLVTFDGLPFDVMALGEFVVARDPDGGFEVQARHEPYPLRGTGTSAVAVGSGAQRITFTGDDLADEPAITVRVDGEVVTDRESTVTVGEATATPLAEVGDLPEAREHWRVEWPDGTAVDLHWLNGWFVSIEAETERAARLVGLLGSSNDDFRDDLLLPDGSPLPLGPPSLIDEVYAPAWQVDDAATLFDYEGNETLATFVGPPPPPPDPPTEDVVEQCTFALGSGASPTRSTPARTT